jgi:hypothetical protein
MRSAQLLRSKLLPILAMLCVTGCASNMNELLSGAGQGSVRTESGQRIDSDKILRSELYSCNSSQTLHCETTQHGTSCACVSSATLFHRIEGIAQRQRINHARSIRGVHR